MTEPDPERALALSYCPTASRDALRALFALDATLAHILQTTTEPIVGQMRLTWWHDALTRLDATPPPAEPVLQRLARHVLPVVSGATLAGMIEGWEALVDADAIDDDALTRYAAGRGRGLFAAAGTLAAASPRDPVAPAGQGWALVDLAWHARDAAITARALTMAEPLLATASAHRWSRSGRALGALAVLARMDLGGPAQGRRQGAPARVARLLRHRLTGR